MEPTFSRSNRSLPRVHLIAIGSMVLAGIAIYLLAASLTYRLGFPLDDSWIHLTYARNLAHSGQWAFRLNHASAGSTSPLWTVLLVPGFWLGMAPLWWAYLLGAVELFALAVLAEWALRTLLPSYRPRVPWAGLLVASEWHLLWASVSGMETLLQALLATFVLVLLMSGSRRYLGMGILVGVAAWVRPDGLTLAAPVLLVLLVEESGFRDKSRGLLMFFIGAGALVLPYLLFNLALAGRPLPNTFYAKQAEYSVWQAQPFLLQLGALALQLLTGPSLLLLPGAALWFVRILRSRDWRSAAAISWCLAYMLLYIVRLPPYQHGRYLIPAMPLLFMIGLLGFFEFLRSAPPSGWRRALATAWGVALPLLAAGFLLLGARSYGQDVGLIETEMVNTARWVSSNLPANATIAAHDIGALGYFDGHPLIDMAGLVSPEVIPFLRDQVRLRQFLDAHGASYLIAFPNLYPQLTADLRPVYAASGPFAVSVGEPDMAVYCWLCR